MGVKTGSALLGGANRKENLTLAREFRSEDAGAWPGEVGAGSPFGYATKKKRRGCLTIWIWKKAQRAGSGIGWRCDPIRNIFPATTRTLSSGSIRTEINMTDIIQMQSSASRGPHGAPAQSAGRDIRFTVGD